jgi:hypothetical protein
MARTLQKRELILLGLLSAVAVVVWMTQGGEEPPASAAAAAAAKEAARRSAPVIRMDLLTHVEPTSDGGMRDLFKFERRPPSPAEVRRQEAERRRLEKEAEEARKRAEAEAADRAKKAAEAAAIAATLPPPPPPPPSPPAIPFQYIGLIGPKDAKIGVFEEGKDIVIARVGETVRDQFKLVELKHDAAIIGYTRKEFRDRTKELPMKRR